MEKWTLVRQPESRQGYTIKFVGMKEVMNIPIQAQYALSHQISVWQFDDLWEEGYRFDEVTKVKGVRRYCFVSREDAVYDKEGNHSEYQAAMFLKANFDEVEKKYDSTSEPRPFLSDVISGVSVVLTEQVQ
jgi:hypothetical protein